MGKFLFSFMVFIVLKAASQDITNWVRIDCGAPSSYQDKNGLLWRTDDGFIKTGTNANASSNIPTMMNQLQDQLQTVRFFTGQNKNCYNLPAPTSGRYFIRAMFYYGNYDNLFAPSTFDLEFDANKWATVETKMDVNVIYETMYTTKGKNISVCLVRTHVKQFPFISTLEAWQMPSSAYASMSGSVAWITRYRYAYGAESPHYIFGYPDDNLNRIWYAWTPQGLQPVNANFTSLDTICANQPPVKAMLQAVQALSPGYILDLPLPIEEFNYDDAVQLYFTEVLQDSTEIRKFSVQVNTVSLGTISPEYKNCTISSYGEDAQSAGLWDIEFFPSYDSTQPPIISAIEVYTAISLVTTGTFQDDLDGLAILINSFQQLRGWSGEPCIPSDTIWEWLGCSGDNPPRVTSINLSGYNLSGPLPNFSQMKALRTIDLANNNLDGPIPDFLGSLPNLQTLDLSNNKFSGKVPRSIIDNKKLTLRVNGNPDLDQPPQNQDPSPSKKNNHALVIGLAVGIPIALLLVFAVVVMVYFSKKQQAALNQTQATAMWPGGISQGQYNTGPVRRPSHSVEHLSSATNADSATQASVGSTNQETQNQEVDDEIMELLRRHGAGGRA